MNDVQNMIDTFPIVQRILTAVMADYKKQDNPGYSDLHNEQPISIQIHVSLGDLRRLYSLGKPR